MDPQTHQQFLDDNMLMGPSSFHEAMGIKEFLNIFLQSSGLEINKEKSQTYFFNTPKITKRNVLEILDFLEGSLPSKYLGAPMVELTIKQVSWKELVEKINKKLSLWTFIALNFLSRLILVKSVLWVMPIYLFSVLVALKSIIKKIRNIQRKFLWGGTEGNRKWPLVDWQTICTPKVVGGLGLRDPLDNNKVMSAKIRWIWVNNEDEPRDKLWHLKYVPQWPQQSLVRFGENLPVSNI